MGVIDAIWKVLSHSGKATDLKSLTKAQKQDEVLGTLVTSVSALALEGTKVGEIDKALNKNFTATID